MLLFQSMLTLKELTTMFGTIFCQVKVITATN